MIAIVTSFIGHRIIRNLYVNIERVCCTEDRVSILYVRGCEYISIFRCLISNYRYYNYYLLPTSNAQVCIIANR